MRFNEFTQYLEKLEQTSSRLSMTDTLAELLLKCDREDNEILCAIYLIQGRVAPQHEPIEFNYSEKLILRALTKATNNADEVVNKAFKKVGDIGLLVMELGIKKKSADKTIVNVFDKLLQIATIEGKSSQSFKQTEYLDIYNSSNEIELKYINRILTGNLRLGLSSKTILDALALITGDKKNRAVIERAYGVKTDLGLIAQLVITMGVEKLAKIRVESGIPVAPKLVEREKNAEEIFKRIPKSIVQPKLDGLRIHAHYRKAGFKKYVKSDDMNLFQGQVENVKLFSRNLESLTKMFPDIVKAINELASKIDATSFILDGEAIGIDLKTGAFLPFQETIKRRRKNDISAMSHSHPVKLFAFDVLELNGEDLLLLPTQQRIETLQKMLSKGKSNTIVMTESTFVESASQIQSLFEKYVSEGYEGIVVKDVASFYKPGTRNFDWIKLKAASVEGYFESIDSVVLGYYYGSGSRTKFGIGAILIGNYSPEDDKYYSTAKVGTGFKDADWKNIKDSLDKLRVEKIPFQVVIADSLVPDVIVTPKIVVEVESDMVTKSKTHGGLGGFSLRFPRLKQFDRDKSPTDCTTLKEIKRIFELQNK